MQTIGERIRHLRKLRKMTQKQLAQKVGGLTSSAITQWENDQTLPSGKSLLAVALALKVTPNHILHGDDKVQQLDAIADIVAAEIGPDAMHLLRLWRTTPENVRSVILNMIEVTASNSAQPQTSQANAKP
jgi:transcriptional regulator with XRE-family HTH domain